ncbi:hypothetical protein ES708_28735 [subsurface metagenome]
MFQLWIQIGPTAYDKLKATTKLTVHRPEEEPPQLHGQARRYAQKTLPHLFPPLLVHLTLDSIPEELEYLRR